MDNSPTIKIPPQNTPSKTCELCGITFFKQAKESITQWDERRVCSKVCANKLRVDDPVHIRFWKFTERKGTNECWPWRGSTDKHGYGRISAGMGAGASPLKAYRVAYEMFNGAIPSGFVIRHKCDNPNCVNPNHLEVGTQKDNAQDMVKRGRMNHKSFLNLRPGQKGVRGAGEKSNKELERHGIC